MSKNNQIIIDVPEPIMTLWSLSGMFCNNYFDSETEMLIEYKKKQKESEEKIKGMINLEECHKDDNNGVIDRTFKGVDIINATLPGIVRYDYLGTFLGSTDVFEKTVYSKKGKEKKSFITCGVDTDHYSYLVVDSKRGIRWNGAIGDISDLYRAFRERGIEFENDIYMKEEEMYKKHVNELRKKYPKFHIV